MIWLMIDSSPSALGAGHVRVAPLAAIEVGAGQQFHHADHAVHRRADLVGHVRQELALAAVGLFGAHGAADLGFGGQGLGGSAGVAGPARASRSRRPPVGDGEDVLKMTYRRAPATASWRQSPRRTRSGDRTCRALRWSGHDDDRGRYEYALDHGREVMNASDAGARENGSSIVHRSDTDQQNAHQHLPRRDDVFHSGCW